MAVYSREDDLVIALKEATRAMAHDGRFSQVASVNGESSAARKTIEVADVFVAWLRRVSTVKLVLVALEEQTTEVVATFTQGGIPVSSMDTSQQLRYVIEAADDRKFPVDATLSVEVSGSNPGAVSATILEAASGTASGKDELLVVALAPGSALVKVFDPAQADTVFGSDAVDVVPGGVAAVVLAAPTTEEQPPVAPPVA